MPVHPAPRHQSLARGYQIQLFNDHSPEGWLAAGGVVWDTADEALRYLYDVWDENTHKRVALLKDGKLLEQVEPKRIRPGT
jgi:hypothetical protein